MDVYFAGTLMIAAVLALTGTNAQARIARRQMLGSEDPLISTAARAWRPVPTWLMFGSARRSRIEAEAAVRVDPARWTRYADLTSELRAWNALESSVALALPAAVAAFLSTLIG